MIFKEKRKNGVAYQARIYFNGRRISKTFERRADAEAWERFYLHQKDRGALGFDVIEPKAPCMTLRVFSQKWLVEKVEAQLSPSTQYAYKCDLKNHILPVVGDVPLDKIHPTHANQIISQMKAKGRSVKTINETVTMLKSMLFEAMRWEIIDRNPLHAVRRMKASARQDSYWTAAEVEQFLASNEQNAHYNLFVVALNTGMRRGEICALKWDRVSFQRNQIEVTRTSGRWGVRETTKSGKKRIIPMNDTVRSILFNLRKEIKSEFVFSTEKGKPVDAHHLYRDFTFAQTKAGFDSKIRFHDLRHTFASHFMMNGGNIYDLQKILGHYSLDMTQRYAHLSPAHLANAAQIVNFGRNRQEFASKTEEDKKIPANAGI
jgi:integrase